MVATLWPEIAKLNNSTYGQMKTLQQFDCTGLVGRQSVPPEEVISLVIKFLFMEPLLAFLRGFSAMNAAKIACSAGGRAVPPTAWEN